MTVDVHGCAGDGRRRVVTVVQWNAAARARMVIGDSALELRTQEKIQREPIFLV